MPSRDDTASGPNDKSVPQMAERPPDSSSPFGRRRLRNSPIKKLARSASVRDAQDTYEFRMGATDPPRKQPAFNSNAMRRPWLSLRARAHENDLLNRASSNRRLSESSLSSSDHLARREISSSTLRSYYDPAQSPLLISQQTSASAVRDMALRKGRPTIHEAVGQPEPYDRPAVYGASVKDTRHGNTSRTKKRPAKLDLSKLFPAPTSRKGNILSPNKLMHSPSSLTTASDFFPQETLHLQLRKPSDNALYQSAKCAKPSRAPIQEPRAKVFDKDIYDSGKVNVRRPPKGIQNWFDALTDSDDEEGEGEEGEPQLVTPELYYALKPPVVPDTTQATQSNRVPVSDPILENMLAIEHAKTWMKLMERQIPHRRSGECSNLTTPEKSRQHDNSAATDHSRIATACLAEHSVLHLSSSSEDDWPGLQVTNESCVGDANADEAEARLSARLRISRTKKSIVRESADSTQTTESIPIIHDDNSSPLTRNPVFDFSSAAKRRSRAEPLLPPSPSTFGDNISEEIGYFGEAERTAVSVDLHSLTSTQDSKNSIATLPAGAAHMMVVTDEEMVLLEMMRRKRATMQKQNFIDGRLLGLEQEQESLVERSSKSVARARTSGFLSLGSSEGLTFPSPPMTLPEDPCRTRRTTPLSLSTLRAEQPSVPLRSSSQPGSTSGSSARSRSSNHNSTYTPESTTDIDLDFPMPRTFATRPSQRKHRSRPYVLNPDLCFQPLELPPHLTRASVSSPSLTSRASPVTPTFSSTSPTPYMDGSCIDIASAGSDRASIRSSRYLTERNRRGTKTTSQEILKRRIRHDEIPSHPLDTTARERRTHDKMADRMSALRALNRASSIRSVTSASDDVLAAWTALGGSGDLNGRKIRPW
ncbi:hypothetical protein LTR50_005267 [Elasticomyces elasticus]|nr:hypothetical protein LTR50_005267 [Elasticomyces elasticus]